MASFPVTPLTEDEYLRIERAATEKSEFHDGEMFAMSGGSNDHSYIASRMISLLDRQLPPGCRVFNSDLRIKVPAKRTYLYADGGIVCGDPRNADDHNDNLLNPTLIVEVLSPSTEDYDRGKKFELYRAIDSFREYLIVHQDARHVEHYSRQEDGSWILREYTGPDATVTIARWDMRLSLADLYSAAVNLD